MDTSIQDLSQRLSITDFQIELDDIASNLGIAPHQTYKLDGDFHSHLEFDNSAYRGRTGYIGEWRTTKNGIRYPFVTFRTQRHGGQSVVFNGYISVLDKFEGNQPISSSKPIVASPIKSMHLPNDRKREALQRVWDKSLPSAHTDAEPLRRYLRNRNLGDVVGHLSKVVRFHPGLEYWENGKSLGKHPAMLCRLDSSKGNPVSIHRTYLTEDGYKAPVPCPKKLMSSPVAGVSRGAAIRLFKASDTLAVAEGVETAFAVHIATRIPTWATVSAGGMATLQLPKSIRTIKIMADLDRSGAGELSARKLAKQLLIEGRDVFIVRPDGPIPRDMKGVDWLDMLRKEVVA